MQEKIECEICKERVKKINARQRFCSDGCREQHKRNEVIRKWVEKKPRKSDPDLSGRIERSAVYNKTGGWARKFSGVRG